MAERPAVNTSPLILLSKVDLLPLLRLAGHALVVPRAVVREVEALGADNVTLRAISDAAWLTVVETPPVPDVLRRWKLGTGEAAVLAWALAHTGTQAILDDRIARRCAATLGIPVRGTVGLVLAAKQRGIVPLARPVLDQLRQAGLHLADRTMNEALALVGE